MGRSQTKAGYPPLFSWVTVQATQNPILGFTYIDSDAGPTVKGTAIQGEPTLEDAKRAIEAPEVAVRMGTFAFNPITDEQMESLCLPNLPSWYMEHYDDGTHALFAIPEPDADLTGHAGSYRYLRVNRAELPAVRAIPIEDGCGSDAAERQTLPTKALRFLGTLTQARRHAHESARRSGLVSQASLDEITARGRLIAQLDRIAEWGSDAVNGIGPDPRRLGYYIPYRQGDRWCVAFGRMSTDGSSFMTAYEAVGNGPYGWPFDVDVYDPAREDRGWLRSAGRAIAISRKQPVFSSSVESYNCVAVPEPDGSSSVYWYPGTKAQGVTVLGADFRVAVSTSGDVAIEPYHKALLQTDPWSPLFAHTHLLVPGPVPTDVSSVVMGRPPYPSLIICEHWSYFVARDGGLVPLDLNNDPSIDVTLIDMIEKAIEDARR